MIEKVWISKWILGLESEDLSVVFFYFFCFSQILAQSVFLFIKADASNTWYFWYVNWKH